MKMYAVVRLYHILGEDKVARLQILSYTLLSLLKIRARHILCGTVIALLYLSMTGCTLPKPIPANSIPAAIIPPQDLYEVQQRKIERLEQLLAEKEEQIRNLNLRQQNQAKALQESTSKVTRDQVRLRRLATQPSAASSIAEAEVAMVSLKSSQVTTPERTLQAQRLLNAATASYAKGNYGAAMDHSAQAREFIEMVMSNHTRKASGPHLTRVFFNVPIPLRAKSNVNLRQRPFSKATKLATLKKNSALTAQAYQGDWLQVQASDLFSGWVLNTLMEVREEDLNQ